MKKFILSSIVLLSLTACAGAQLTKQEQPLVGDWLCKSEASKADILPFDVVDRLTFNADHTLFMRGIKHIRSADGEIRYLNQAKTNWKVENNRLILDFKSRRFTPAHDPKVTKAMSATKEGREMDKLYTEPCDCGDRLDLDIKFKGKNRLIMTNHYAKQVSQCRKLASGEQTTETKLIDKLMKEKG